MFALCLMSNVMSQESDITKAVKKNKTKDGHYYATTKCTKEQALGFFAGHPNYKMVKLDMGYHVEYGYGFEYVKGIYFDVDKSQPSQNINAGDMSEYGVAFAEKMYAAMGQPRTENGVRYFFAGDLPKADLSKWKRNAKEHVVLYTGDNCAFFTTKDQLDVFRKNNKHNLKDSYYRQGTRASVSRIATYWLEKDNYYAVFDGYLFDYGEHDGIRLFADAVGPKGKTVVVRQYDKMHVWVGGYYGCIDLMESSFHPLVSPVEYRKLPFDESAYASMLKNKEEYIYQRWKKSTFNKDICRYVGEYCSAYGKSGRYYNEMESALYNEINKIPTDYLYHRYYGDYVVKNGAWLLLNTYQRCFNEGYHVNQVNEVCAFCSAISNSNYTIYSNAYPNGRLTQRLSYVFDKNNEAIVEMQKDRARRENEKEAAKAAARARATATQSNVNSYVKNTKCHEEKGVLWSDYRYCEVTFTDGKYGTIAYNYEYESWYYYDGSTDMCPGAPFNPYTSCSKGNNSYTGALVELYNKLHEDDR